MDGYVLLLIKSEVYKIQQQSIFLKKIDRKLKIQRRTKTNFGHCLAASPSPMYIYLHYMVLSGFILFKKTSSKLVMK